MSEALKKHTLLITGGSGFIGINLVDFLLKKTDWQINILDNFSTGSLDDLKKIKNSFPQRVGFYKGDIRKKGDIGKAISKCDYIVHLAAQTGVEPSQKDPFFDAKVNVMGTLNLLASARARKIEKFIFASSAACLGEQKPPINEKKVPCPLSPYGASKLAGEAYCSAYAYSFDLKSVVLRFSNVYGPYSYQKSSVVPKFIKQILAQEAVTIFGEGTQTRDFVYVEDICQAIFLSLTKTLPDDFSLFQIGTGKEISINALFELLREEFSKKGYEVLSPLYEKAKKGEIKRNYTDISKAKKKLGFSPQVKLFQGIKKTLNWFLKNMSKAFIERGK